MLQRDPLSLIQKNLKHELTNPLFTLSSAKIEKILLKSISNEWPGIPCLIKQNIIENLFNGLNYEEISSYNHEKHKSKKCHCCKCICKSCKKRNTDATSSLLLEDQINSSLI